MPKGSKRRSSERYSIFEGGEHIPRPDMAMFKQVCKEAAAELDMNWEDVYKLYRRYVEYSLRMAFPEDNPKELPDSELLTPRRIINIKGICSAEVTNKSLWSWRQIEQKIKNKRK